MTMLSRTAGGTLNLDDVSARGIYEFDLMPRRPEFQPPLVGIEIERGASP